ncbi:MAG: hypothetical protein JWR16_2345 [Nevskia sp.]|nr:hypothetical protein [Nevskia sp.]
MSTDRGRRLTKLGPYLIAITLATFGHGSVQASVNPGDRVGAEFNVASVVTGFQSRHEVAMDAAGNSVAVWENSLTGNGSDWEIHARCFDATGMARGSDFVVDAGNKVLPGDTNTIPQRSPAVAMDPSGDFTVAWESYGVPAYTHTTHVVRARTYKPNCTTAVNAFTVGNGISPAVALDVNGNAVIAWSDAAQIYAARYNALGGSLIPTFPVDSGDSAYRQYRPAVAINPQSGDFVVAWSMDRTIGTLFDIYAQRFNSSAIAQGPLLSINQYTTEVQDSPSVSFSSAGGSFTVAWESFGQDVVPPQLAQQIYARRFNSAGALTNEFRVNPAATGFKWSPAVAADEAANFWTAWMDSDGGGFGSFFRWYRSGNATFDTTVRANTSTANSQVLPAVAGDADGDLLIAWTDQGPGGSSDDVKAVRFAGHRDVDVALSKTSSSPSVPAGSALSYVLKISNTEAMLSPTGVPAIDAYIGSASTIRISDMLPAGMLYSGFSSGDPAWACSAAGALVNCQYADVLLASSSTSVQLQVVAPGSMGSVSNSATVGSAQYDSVQGNNNSSVAISVSPLPLPAAPANVTATAGNGSVTLNWTASANATSYTVYKSTSSHGEAPPIALTIVGGATTTGTITGLTNGTKYYFVMQAVNASGHSTTNSNEVSATPN